MSGTYLTNGIVLRRRDYREVDRVVTVLTEEYGKIDAVARGVRKIVSKLAGHLEPFSYASFMLARGRVFDVLATSVKRSSYRIPQTDLTAFALTSFVFEAVDRLTRPNQPDRQLFYLLLDYLEAIENELEVHGGSPAFQRLLLTLYFLFQTLAQLGYMPAVERCVVGKEELVMHDVVFSAQHGGLVCATHRSPTDAAQPLSAQAIAMVRLMADGELDALRFVKRNDESLQEVGRLLNSIVVYQLGEPLRSTPYIAQLFGVNV